MHGPDKWTELVGALGPFLAASVALWIAWRSTHREKRSRPKLTLHFDSSDREDFVMDIGSEHERDVTHLVRLRVANAHGRRTAEDVEVLLVGVDGDAGDSIVRTQPLHGHVFAWAPMVDPRALEATTRVSVAPGSARHFNLLRLSEPTVTRAIPGQTGAMAALMIFPRPDDTRHYLTSGLYLVYLLVTARDTDAAYFVVEVTHDGKWWAAPEVRRHLKVRVFEGEQAPLQPVPRLWDGWVRYRKRRARWWWSGGWRAGVVGQLRRK